MRRSRTLISVVYRVWFSLSCHWRYSMRPSTYRRSPFLQYFSTTSARPVFLAFHTTQRCHSVFSCFSPLALFHCRLVASENVATFAPPVVVRISGSLPRFPIRLALLRLRLTLPPGEGCILAHYGKTAFETAHIPKSSAIILQPRAAARVRLRQGSDNTWRGA